MIPLQRRWLGTAAARTVRLVRDWLNVLEPVQFLVLFFLVAIAVGTALLLVPWATPEGQSISLIDALFTATSATCVTGLIVKDTGSEFTLFGQGVILALIQLGGLGVMTASTMLLLALGERVSLRNLYMLRDEYTVTGLGSARRLFWTILLFTGVAEVIGAVVLSLRFADVPPGELGHDPVWCGVFHSISSFCNAGFSLFPDSFSGFRGDPTVNVSVPLLIIFGGIGFPALIDLLHYLVARRRGQRMALSLHARIVFSATICLLVLGTALFYGLEYKNELAGAPAGEKLGAAWFQSVTTRTAGFNTIDMGRAAPPTLLLTVLLMFIGGSPGSTAGGVKTTTFVVIILVVYARLRGHERVEAGGRTIPVQVITKALVVALLGIALIAVATLLLLITDGETVRRIQSGDGALTSSPDKTAAISDGTTPAAAAARGDGPRHGAFVILLFEVVSAFGTVGLSMLSVEATGALTGGGKLLIIVVMYLGRLGPLVLARMVLLKDRPLRYHYPEEYLLVG
jgi:trk system potassium uptake protein TrkH